MFLFYFRNLLSCPNWPMLKAHCMTYLCYLYGYIDIIKRTVGTWAMDYSRCFYPVVFKCIIAFYPKDECVKQMQRSSERSGIGIRSLAHLLIPVVLEGGSSTPQRYPKHKGNTWRVCICRVYCILPTRPSSITLYWWWKGLSEGVSHFSVNRKNPGLNSSHGITSCQNTRTGNIQGSYSDNHGPYWPQR